MLKRLKASRIIASVGGSVLASYIRLVYHTSKLVYEPADQRETLPKFHPGIMAMWHGQFMMLPKIRPVHLPVKIMVARHEDAELIAQALLRFNMQLIRGAGAGNRKKDRGGASALIASIKALQDNISVAMTADVPPGPARISGTGIVTLARMSGRPIIPAATATSNYFSLNSWSRFTINLPFSTLAFVVGDPIYVPEDADEQTCERLRQEVENSLNQITQKAYQLAGANPMNATPASALPADAQLPKGITLKFYQALTKLAQPLVPYFLSKRQKKGKEDPTRIQERFGIAGRERPEGKLVWFHAASVGETNAILPLIHKLRKEHPELSLLLTTGTVTSAKLAIKRLPDGAIHQYIPVDAPGYVDKFLAHWTPDLALLTESEIWPNLIIKTGELKIPLILLNGIISDKSFKRWRKKLKMARALFGQFGMILTQNARLAKRFDRLGARKTVAVGNLKMDAPMLPVNRDKREALEAEIAGRVLFLAASTHNGEEEIIGQAHKKLNQTLPDLLTIIAPRHPERGEDIAAQLEQQGLSVARRSLGQMPGNDTDIYIADTIGELGIFYSLATLTFMGGSLIPHGGQNPIEAIKLDTAVVTGPHWHNFKDIYGELTKAKAVIEVDSAESLAAEVKSFLTDYERLNESLKSAHQMIDRQSGALDKTYNVIEPYLPKPSTTELKGVA